MTNDRRRVLLFIPTLAGGGAERFFATLLRYLDRSRFELHLALMEAKGEYVRDVPSDVTVHDLNCSRARYAPARLVPLIRRVKPHAILSTLPHANIALLLSAPLIPSGTKKILSEAAFTTATLQEGANPRFWAWLIRQFYRRADTVVCLCDSMIDDLERNYKVPRRKLTRIYYPVDLDRVREMALSEPNPFSGVGPHFVAAGRLCHQKGFDLLLSAMSIVRQRLPQADLTILGEGPLAGELSAQAERLGLQEAVRFPGFQSNPWRYFKHANAFVLSSRFEGLPNVILEALALETPVVAFNCPGAIGELRAACPRLVAVPPEDPLALAEAVVSVCENGKAGWMRDSSSALEKFSVAQIVSEYSDLFLS